MRNFLRLSISCETKKSCHVKLNSWNSFFKKDLEKWSIIHTTSLFIQHSFRIIVIYYCLHDKKGSLTLEIFIDKMFFFIHWLKTNILTTLPYVELEFCKNQNKTRCKDLNLQLCNLPWNSLHEYEFQFCQLLLTRRFPNVQELKKRVRSLTSSSIKVEK